ncbi:MAG: S8/S53 family peptidase [bacterium]|nr:S8/S53 family peptidase [bacterium]
MKKTIFMITLALACMFAQAQVIDPLLQEEMNRRTDSEMIEITVLMKSRCDRNMLNQRASALPTRAERRAFVVDELKHFTEVSQRDLKLALAEMEQKGEVTATRTLWMSNSLYFSATKETVLALSKRDDIAHIGYNIERKWIEDDEKSTSANETREITPNILKVNADRVWESGFTGQGVVVSIIDAGVNYNHLDLADHLWDGGEAFPHHGYDVRNDDDDPMDDMGHGTHCAGTVAGDGTAGSQTGVAPDAQIMCIKSVNADGTGGAVKLAEGMEWSVEHGCDIISMSMGLVHPSVTERELFRRTCVSILDAGVSSFICAGNEGFALDQYPIPQNVRIPGSCPPPYLDPDQMANPGELSSAIVVGSVDDNDQASFFTANGPCTWQDTEFGDYAYNPGIGLIRPDVCAPGESIKSLNYTSNTGYKSMTGTSQATPCVAGIAALMLSKNPELSPADICRILEETSVKLTPTKSNLTGVGRVDALAAVNAVEAYDGLDEGNAKASIYPNPTKDVVNIECEGMTKVKVFSMDGKLVKVLGVNGSQCHIDDLESGIYLIMVETVKGSSLKKIVKL